MKGIGVAAAIVVAVWVLIVLFDQLVEEGRKRLNNWGICYYCHRLDHAHCVGQGCQCGKCAQELPK